MSLKPVDFKNEEQETQMIVADNWKIPQTRHVLTSFVLVALVLYFVSFLSPFGKSQVFSSVSLPVYAGSGPFDIKIRMNEISPFFQRISLYSRFISENFQGKIITDGKFEFVPYRNKTQLKTKTINFGNKTFELTARGSSGNWVEMLNIDLIYFDAFEVISHFSSAAKNAVSIEFKVETSTVAFTCFDIWCRFSFAVALSFILIRKSSYLFIDEYDYSFYTYLLLFINLFANNPLHAFSFLHADRMFYHVDYFLKSIQEAYNIFYCCWIYSTTSYTSKVSFYVGFAALYVELSPFIREGFGPESSPSGSIETNILALAVFVIGMIVSIALGYLSEDDYDYQLSARKCIYLSIIFITRIPHYAVLFIKSEGHFNGNPLILITHYISNNFFAILMLYANLRIPQKTLNMYQEASEIPDSVPPLLED